MCVKGSGAGGIDKGLLIRASSLDRKAAHSPIITAAANALRAASSSGGGAGSEAASAAEAAQTNDNGKRNVLNLNLRS